MEGEGEVPDDEVGPERRVYWPLGVSPIKRVVNRKPKAAEAAEAPGLREADEGEGGGEGARKWMARKHKPSLSSDVAAWDCRQHRRA